MDVVKLSVLSLNHANIYHDAFIQRGGAESVVEQWSKFLQITPSALAVNHEIDWDTSGRPKALLNLIKNQKQLESIYPLLPIIEKFFTDLHLPEEIRLVSTTGIAHQLPGNWAKRVVYMHSPTRWIWDKVSFDIDRQLLKVVVANLLRNSFQKFDRSRILENDILIANSTYTSKRIKMIFKRNAKIIFPPVRKILFQETRPKLLDGVDFFLAVGRNKGYKNLQHAISASQRLGFLLVIVGEGTEMLNGHNHIGLGKVTDAELKWLYMNANALIACSKEDFGLTPIEAAYFGCPTIAYKHLGYLDSVMNGVNGEFVEPDNIESLTEAIKCFNRSHYNTLAMTEFASCFTIEKHLKSIESVLND